MPREKELKRRKPVAFVRTKTESDLNLRAETQNNAPDFSFRDVRDEPATAETRQRRRQTRQPTTETLDRDNLPIRSEDIFPLPTEEAVSVSPISSDAEIPGTGSETVDTTTAHTERRHTTKQHGTEYERRFQETAKTESSPTSRPDEPKKQSKLNFTADELPPDTSPKVSDNKLVRAQDKATRAADKLERAETRLPARRKLRMETASDPDTGKAKKRLRFEKQVKSQAEHIKGPLPTRPLKAGANAAGMMLHNRIYRDEHENVGLEAAHRAELAGESAARSVYRYHKTAPYRKVSRLQKKVATAEANAAYQQVLEDNPELKKKKLARMWQKQKLKRQYAQAAREAQRTGKRAKETAVTTEKIAERVVQSVKRHPIIYGIAALFLLVLFLITSILGSFSGIGSGGFGSFISSTYLADDRDIDDAELAYTEWETDLQMQINSAETDYPGYDEYRYTVDDISHDPYELLAYLTAVYQDFIYADVKSALQEIFDEQYNLSFSEEIEIRYRTETVTDPSTGDEYETEVPYEWRILNVTLTSRSFSDIVKSRMSDEQLEVYNALLLSKGNRQYVRNVLGLDWSAHVSSRYGYRVRDGVKNYHPGVDISVEEGTEIRAGHDSTVTFADNAGDYGLCIVLEGETIGGHTVTTKYGHCSLLLVSVGQTVKAGDVIAKTGNTGTSNEPHLHLEVLLDGQYLNPLYFAVSGAN